MNNSPNNPDSGAYLPASTDNELLDVVDFDDRTIGVATRREIHQKGLIHRAIHVIITNPQGHFLQQKRSSLKDRFPGWWDISVGGHLNAGELYLEAAQRECREEMGLPNLNLERVCVMPPTAINGFEHIHVFTARLKDVSLLAPNPDEIAGVRWVSLEDYKRLADPDSLDLDWRVTPCSHHTLKEWIRVGAPGTQPLG